MILSILFQFSGCMGHHGPYSFYKSVLIDGRLLGLSSFFPVRIYPDSAIFSIAEVQLLWSDRAENFVSLRLYFLPENTPDGRLRHHGEVNPPIQFHNYVRMILQFKLILM